MTTAFAKFKPLLTLLVGFFAALGVLSVTRIGPAQAQSPGVNLAALVARLNADEATIAALQAKTAPLSVDGNTLTITGVNVQIVDGTGATKSRSALGNLTIGYNETGNPDGDVRIGSHNLILGDQNSYSSYGGLIAGTKNTIRAPYATVSGGNRNEASGVLSSVSGGNRNEASGNTSSASGGYLNKASGTDSSVSGGSHNTADSFAASVSGGSRNEAGHSLSSVSGGFGNTASGSDSSVSGGTDVTQTTQFGWSAGSEGGAAVKGNFTSP